MKKNKISDIRITLLDYLLWLLITVFVSFIASVIISFVILRAELSSIMYVLNYKYLPLLTVATSIILLIPFFYVAYIQYERNYVVRRLMSMRKAIEGNLENAHFMTKKEMIDNGYKTFNSLSELQNCDDSIILSLNEEKGALKGVLSPEKIHTLILGTTGSGKTAGYIIPSIKALANTKTKPSFLFTDPKGELNDKTAWYLKEQGYDVKVLDFRHPERSLRWNPLALAYEKYQKAQTIIETTTLKDGMYHFNGQVYDVDSIEDAERAEEQRLEDEAFEEIQSIIFALCPVNTKDPIWDNGARSLIQAVTLAMLEDSKDDMCDMTIDKFCFYNVAKICSKTENNCEELKSYFKYRSKTSLAVQYSGMVLNAPDKQQGSYMSSVAEKLMLFNDRGICNMTSGRGEINVQDMDERPTAIYIVLPDEKVGRHALGSLFISEAYKRLVMKAVENGGRLKRNVYFMMDEFGNMPKVDGIASMFTVGRSRGIIQMPVIQSYSQLIDKYGAETAKTIFGNCNTEIFIGAKDDETCEKFSRKLGNYSVMSTNVTGMKRTFEHNFSESLKERPLMYPRELTLLNNSKNMGNVVVLNQGYSPSLGKFTPYFKSKVFEDKTVINDDLKPRSLPEEVVYYEFQARAINIENEVRHIEQLEKEYEEDMKKRENDEKSSFSEMDNILKQLSPFAESVNKEFSNDTEENKRIIDEIIQLFRQERAIVKLNQVLKLKAAFDKVLDEENQGE